MFSNVIISFSCTSCGHEARKSMRWLRNHDEFICNDCGRTISLKTDQMAISLKEADQRAGILQQRLRNLGRAILEK